MNQIIFYFLTISGLSTIVIWLGKLVISKSFDAGIERYKASLAKEIEEYKNQLAKVSLEHQIKFTKLHDERAEKIKSLYSKVIELEVALIHSTTIAQGPEYINDNERDDAAMEKLRILINSLDLDRIYFSVSSIEKFDSIIKESWEIIFQMRKVRRYANAIEKNSRIGREVPEIYYSETDLWDDANNRTEKEFKILKNNLADEFRELLGI